MLFSQIEQMTETYEAELDSLRSEVRECEGLLKSEQRSRSEQVSQLLAAHETQIKQLVIQHADEYSNSKVAQLQTKVSTQEVSSNNCIKLHLSSNHFQEKQNHFQEKQTGTSKVGAISKSQKAQFLRYA